MRLWSVVRHSINLPQFFLLLSAFSFCMNMWTIASEDGEWCSPSADTVIIDDEVVMLGAGRTLADVARNAAAKKPAPTCEACDMRVINRDVCLSGNIKLCEMCDLAEWAAGMCSSCGDMPATRDQPLCSAQLCDVCDLSLWVIQNGFM